MTKILVMYIAILVFSTSAFAVDKYSGSKFTGTVNLIASTSNQSVGDISGAGALNDSAYQFQLNYTLGGQQGMLGLVKSDYYYVSVRAFRFIERYDSDCSGVPGASELEGLAAFYGHRYIFTSKAYQGFGAGWYTGGAFGDDRYVEPGCGGSGSEALLVPVAAAEIFYIYNFNKSFFIEPGVLFISDNKQFSGEINVFPQIIIGGIF